MEKYYKYNSRRKKEMLNKWTKSRADYKKNNKLAIVLYGIAIAIVIGFSATMVMQTGMEFLWIAFFTGIMLGIIPFAVGSYFGYKGKKLGGQPYNSMEREFLYVNEYGLQFGYHNPESKFTASMYVYQIPFEKLNRVHFDKEFNVLSLMGIGELICYDDYSTGRINLRNSERKFYNDSTWSFILAFDEQEEILRLLKDKQNWED